MSMPPFSCCNAREPHVTRTGHTDGDDIVAPGPRAYNPAQLMIVACVPGIFFGPYCSVICTDTQTIFYHYYCITARHRHLYNPRNCGLSHIMGSCPLLILVANSSWARQGGVLTTR